MFHLLRRQVKRPWRKPLVVMTPKSLLRLPAATSTLDELTTGTYQRILPDPAVPVAGANRVLLCSGKIYFELAAARDKRGDRGTAVVRLEQLYPLRADHVHDALAGLAPDADVAWVQDEPANMGAASFIAPRLAELLGRPVRRGRPRGQRQPRDRVPQGPRPRVRADRLGGVRLSRPLSGRRRAGKCPCPLSHRGEAHA
jgi:2-oxoglutarate dehydrogenase complex dehydrogenase (E1) component-like enzyme